MSDIKFTDEVIIEAFANCNTIGRGCPYCPITPKTEDVCDSLTEKVIDLLHRQRAEIEKLQKLLDDKCDRCIERDRAEAIKEFADRLRSHYPHTQSILKRIDCIEKKMTEDKNDG